MEIDTLITANDRLKQACDIFEKNSEACVVEYEARLKAETEIVKLKQCIEEGHSYGDEPDCFRCGHYGPRGA